MEERVRRGSPLDNEHAEIKGREDGTNTENRGGAKLIPKMENIRVQPRKVQQATEKEDRRSTNEPNDQRIKDSIAAQAKDRVRRFHPHL